MRTPLLALLLACGGQTVGTASSSTPWPPADDGGTYAGEIPLLEAAAADEPAADPPASATPASVAVGGDDSGAVSAAVPAPPFDAGPGGVCPGPLAPGDLVIDELMIESLAGTGDYGEWLEARSTLGCALDLRGLHGECPRGAKVATFDVTGDLWLPPGGTFVIADSGNAAIDHDLPGPLVVWSGQPGDVLRNKGTTITLRLNDAVIDTVTYPVLPLTVGASLAFPGDCDPALRSDWTRWQTSTASWFPGFLGTPNAPNDDVRCEHVP